MVRELGERCSDQAPAANIAGVLGAARRLTRPGTNLYLRKVIQRQALDNYHVILKLDEGEFEIESIGIQHGAVGLGN